jgi:hypothetical protein
MRDFPVILTFPSDMAELGVTGKAPDYLPDDFPDVPIRKDQLCFPDYLRWSDDNSPVVFTVVSRLFTTSKEGVKRCDVQLVQIEDFRLHGL